MKTNFLNISKRIVSACQKSNRDSQTIKLIWVSKTKPISQVNEAYGLGARDFGENKIQEIVEKFSVPEKGVEVHAIGPIQSNKLRKAAALTHWIHTITSVKQINKLEKFADEFEKPLKILFQVNTSGEESKSGIQPEQLRDFLSALPTSTLLYSGLMTIGVTSGNPEDSRKGFLFLKEIRDEFYQKDSRFTNFSELSMGMSGDMEVAIEEGSTMIRVGSALFGARDYA
jgi:hypothetical protein